MANTITTNAKDKPAKITIILRDGKGGKVEVATRSEGGPSGEDALPTPALLMAEWVMERITERLEEAA